MWGLFICVSQVVENLAVLALVLRTIKDNQIDGCNRPHKIRTLTFTPQRLSSIFLYLAYRDLVYPHISSFYFLPLER